MNPLDTLRGEIERLAADLPGTLGASILFLEDGARVDVQADISFPAASMIKVPIMVEAYRRAAEGALDLEEMLTVRTEDRMGGSGLLQFLHPGLQLTVRDAIELMITVSDNVATNLVLARVGHERVNQTMAEWGLPQLWSAGFLGHGANPPSQATPRAMTDLLTRVAQREIITPEACDAMLTTLERQLYDDGLPRSLPVMAYPERAGLAASPVRVAHKTGSLDGVRHDAGLLLCQLASGPRTISISVFTKDLHDGDLWTPDNIGLVAIARVARQAYDTQLALE